jgi:hypothetical protein
MVCRLAKKPENMAGSHYSFWLAASLLAIASCQALGKMIMVGEEQGWTLGVDYKDLYVSTGDTLVRNYHTLQYA